MNDRAHLEAEVLRLRDRAVGRATPEDGQAQAVAILARAAAASAAAATAGRG